MKMNLKKYLSWSKKSQIIVFIYLDAFLKYDQMPILEPVIKLLCKNQDKIIKIVCASRYGINLPTMLGFAEYVKLYLKSQTMLDENLFIPIKCDLIKSLKELEQLKSLTKIKNLKIEIFSDLDYEKLQLALKTTRLLHKHTDISVNISKL